MIVRDNPAVTELLENRVIQMRAAVRQAEVMVDLANHPGWPSYLGKFKKRLVELEGELDEFQTLDSEARALLLHERAIYRRILNMAAELSDDLPKLHAEMKVAEAKLNERKTRNSPINP